MPFEPRTVETIKNNVESDVTSDIAEMTNFGEGTFNDQFLTAYAEQIREAEIKALVAELAGFVDFAGKEITASDLDRLGITTVTPDEVNQYVEESQLDELGKLVGEERFQGQRAAGQVTFTTTSDTVEIPEGYPVGTEPDAGGDFFQFRVDADGDGEISDSSTATVSPDAGQTQVTANIIADDVGTDYNVGADRIGFMPNPRAGVEDVTNNSETSGGQDRQENPSLREDIKDSVFENSGGGTVDGIIGTIEGQTESDVDVGIDEFTNEQPPFVDVIVDGGTESEIKQLIEDSRPVGIEHNFLRPIDITVGAHTDVLGVDIDDSVIANQVERYLVDIGVGGRLSRSGLLSDIGSADSDIESVPALTTFFQSVERDLYEYSSGTDIYELEFGPFGDVVDEEILYDGSTTTYSLAFSDVSDVTVEAVVGTDRVELTQGSTNDFEVVDTDSDGNDDAIKLTNSTTPDDQTTLLVSYAHTQGEIVSVTDEDDNTYVENTDFAVVDDDSDGFNDSLDFSIGGSSPADGKRFTVDYRPRRSFRGDVSLNERQKISANISAIDIDSTVLE